MDDEPLPRRCPPALRLLAASMPILSLLIVSAVAGFGNLVARLANDDQAYYVVVAKNLFVRGPTYDGLYLTNGVHPLFALALGALYRLVPFTWAQLPAASIVLCVLCGAGFVYGALDARPVRSSTALALGFGASSLGVYPVLYRGMEGALAVLVIAAYFALVARRERRVWLLALASVALWAARLELMALPPIALGLAPRALGFDRRERRRLLLGFGASLVAFVLYAAASHHFIGLALPVSGLLKSSARAWLTSFIGLGALALLAALGLALPRFRATAARLWRTHALLTFMAVFYLFHARGPAETVRQTWYYFPLPALLAFAIVELDDGLRARARRLGLGLLVVASLLVSGWEVRRVIPVRAEARRAMQAVVEPAKAHANPGERFMGPGWMALLVGPEFEPFSHDGLVGGVAEYRAIRGGRLLAFAYASGVRFIVTTSSASATTLSLPAPWRTERVSEGAVSTGDSLWGGLAGAQSCGVGRCATTLGVYRLSRAP